MKQHKFAHFLFCKTWSFFNKKTATLTTKEAVKIVYWIIWQASEVLKIKIQVLQHLVLVKSLDGFSQRSQRIKQQ